MHIYLPFYRRSLAHTDSLTHPLSLSLSSLTPRPPTEELTASLSPPQTSHSLAPPSSRYRPRVVSLAPSSSPPSLSTVQEPTIETCRRRCLPLQNPFSVPSEAHRSSHCLCGLHIQDLPI
ncbi:hypothetical protein PIB30_029298 [Stylosanthes scabra]|uniref:Uncharacterized protein n=1 Tax=Stylosanthes scabra TaxID=79078 RepID=A0ABU6XCW3_9FABA|nr:hypothetical protein [Stylosanthes scabra]